MARSGAFICASVRCVKPHVIVCWGEMEGPLNLESEDLSSSFNYTIENNNTLVLLISQVDIRLKRTL